VKVRPRDHQVLILPVHGCSNREIAGQLSISPRTVKQHLRRFFPRAGIRDGRKRVKLGNRGFREPGSDSRRPRDRLTAKPIQIADLVWQGLRNREIGKIIGTTEPVIKNHLRATFARLGRMEPA
jgi:DNA-binding NarL/FixJ family response regulator